MLSLSSDLANQKGDMDMFLNVLSNEERISFAQLLFEVAHADGHFTVDEELQIDVYLTEMGIGREVIEGKHLAISELIQKLAMASESVRRSVYIELVALVFADGDYSSNEKEIIEEMQAAFSFTDQFREEVISWVNEITPIYLKGYALAGLY